MKTRCTSVHSVTLIESKCMHGEVGDFYPKLILLGKSGEYVY